MSSDLIKMYAFFLPAALKHTVNNDSDGNVGFEKSYLMEGIFQE